MRKFSFQNVLTQITALSVGVALTLLLGFAFRAVGAGGCVTPSGAVWSGPTGAPPTNNVCPPLNTSTANQSKGGEPIASLLDVNGLLSSQVLNIFGTNAGGESVIGSTLKIKRNNAQQAYPDIYVENLGRTLAAGTTSPICVEGLSGKFVLCDDDGGGNPPPPPPGGDPYVTLTVNNQKSTTFTTTNVTSISASATLAWTTTNLDQPSDSCVASSDNNAANWNGTTTIGMPSGSSNTPLIQKFGLTTFGITCTQASSGKTATSTASIKACGSYAFTSVFSKNFFKSA